MDDQDYPPDELPPPFMPRLGHLIAHYREICRLSGPDVYQATGINPSTLSQIETGKVTNPHNATLLTLANLFAQHIEGQSAERILEHLIAARDNVPIASQPLPELLAMSDELLAYPSWFQTIAIQALEAILRSLRGIYRRMR